MIEQPTFGFPIEKDQGLIVLLVLSGESGNVNPGIPLKETPENGLQGSFPHSLPIQPASCLAAQPLSFCAWQPRGGDRWR